MPATEILVEATNVSKEYRLGKTTITALRGLSLNIRRGSFVVIAGPSGSGKSTLLNLLGCLDQVQAALTTIRARHRQREATDFADRFGDAVE